MGLTQNFIKMRKCRATLLSADAGNERSRDVSQCAATLLSADAGNERSRVVSECTEC
jgi:hypothetical protein